MQTRIGKAAGGNFFEDFRLGQVIRHGTPRTLSEGDSSLYIGLTGARQPLHSSAVIARLLGFTDRPIDDLLLFNMAFGKTVPDISINALANLGYAEVRFLQPVYAGETIRCESTVIGLRENSNRRSGVVYVRSSCYNDLDKAVLTWVRWVMVRKSDENAVVREQHVPTLLDTVPLEQLLIHARLTGTDAQGEWCDATGCVHLWDDYIVGERIDHPSGMTIDESDHMIATRLYQNTARPHFDALTMRDSKVGRRLVYGGHVISICRALSYDGLENIVSLHAFNAGTHASPTVAGDTLFAFSEVLAKWRLPGRSDLGALRLRLVGLKNTRPADVGGITGTSGAYHPAVVLDLDYTAVMPRRVGNGTTRDV